MIIDCHTHIFPSFFRDQRERFFHEEPDFKNLYQSPQSRLAGKTELISNMDKEDIDQSVIFGFPWKKAEYAYRHNDYIIESVQQNPDRLIGFCCVDPLSKYATKEIERCLRAGLSGIGELAVYDSEFSSDFFSAMDHITALATHSKVPILLHTNEPVGHQYPGKQPMHLSHLFDLLKKYRSNQFILAHWGGGLFFYALMKKEVKEVLKNTWFDTAASPYLYSSDIYRVAGEIIGFDKILFGSDYPLINPGRYMKEMKSAGLSSQSLTAMVGENTLHLLKPHHLS